MKILKKEYKLCVCCMEEHDVLTVEVKENLPFKELPVDYNAIYEYCEPADTFMETEWMITQNDLTLKNAYREKMNLLTGNDISSIRSKYDISQTDLALLLGWGGKTITRYEGHQVQDAAHDAILRKIDTDPEWFITILEKQRNRFPLKTYLKYYQSAMKIFEESQDSYLRKSIHAQYAKYRDNTNACGNSPLDLDKAIDIVRYFSNSSKVSNLYKVKLMKLLWYADSLCFKRQGHSMTGLVYTALSMGAVPVAHKSIIDLKGISFEEVEYDMDVAYHFIPDEIDKYPSLTKEDMDILDAVIEVCGNDTTEQIVQRMHEEVAYKKTKANEVISYEYARELSIG